jgi:putative spermidine/putrescine transport system substrate-binding protein
MKTPDSSSVNHTGKAISNTFLSRRSLLAGGVAAGALAALSACASPFESGGTDTGTNGAGKKLTLTMFCFLGGDLAKMPKEFAKEYTASHKNVEIKFYEQSNAVGYGKMLAQRKADPSTPLVNLGFFNAQTTVQGAGDSMWEKLDYSAMKHAGDILPIFQRKDQFGIGIGSDQYGLVINKDKVTEAPSSWAALWDPKYMGEVCFFTFPWYAVYMAAKLNGGSFEDMEPGWKLWEENAKQIKLIVESNPQYLNVLSSGTAPVTAYFAGTSQQWIDGGAPLQYIVPTEGAIPLPVFLESVAGQSDDQLTECQNIIDGMLEPRWATRWAETSVQIPANSQSQLPSKLADLPAFQKSNVDKFIDVDYDLVGKNNAAWTERWNSDIVSKI